MDFLEMEKNLQNHIGMEMTKISKKGGFYLSNDSYLILKFFLYEKAEV
jgi:hypothetical protein